MRRSALFLCSLVKYLPGCLHLRTLLNLIYGPPRLASATLLISLVLIAAATHAQTRWNTVGPDGGDARSLEAVSGDPQHLYLGTINSWIYESTDEGGSWHRLARLDASDDLVVDDIVVDPGNPLLIYAAAWKFDRPDGGLWVSHDGGKNWKSNPGLQGQSVRAFTLAPSNHNIMFAGTLEGVFRSTDGGASWRQISPQGSREIHEVESLAVDPHDPDIVYVGTWHLPWKTVDGGNYWQNIKQGVIDDSDVFSIIVDPDKPSIVYASACSGIYKSYNGGSLFKKIQGIPATARRTRVLRQDPVHHDTVYAGTTEGLYKTTDAGKTPAIRLAFMRGWSTTSSTAAFSFPMTEGTNGSTSPKGWMDATCSRWPSHRTEPCWREPTTASLVSMPIHPPGSRKTRSPM